MGSRLSWTPDNKDLIPMVETFLKFNVSSMSISERSGRQPPSNKQPLQPMATVPGFLVTMAILLLDRWLQTPPHPPPPPLPLPPRPPSPPSCRTTPLDSFVLPATTTTNQSRTAKKYSITRQELEGGSGMVVVVVLASVLTMVVAEENQLRSLSFSLSFSLFRTLSISRLLTRLLIPLSFHGRETKVDGGGMVIEPPPSDAEKQQTPTPIKVRWNNKMPPITYSKSMAPYLLHTKGWVGFTSSTVKLTKGAGKRNMVVHTLRQLKRKRMRECYAKINQRLIDPPEIKVNLSRRCIEKNLLVMELNQNDKK
ncbi:PREDICTED: uncharacterized protein LOC107071933 [Polistes dominula]|uniref:Uncharacterized protein LOC107071933 n=1 Tax=Polistes dominula TaxID=743375 RepID=A0ABM1J339_POLDO|nr:PREDICTED: uncharacterized protein LOC107071933 [Polistes dominula]